MFIDIARSLINPLYKRIQYVVWVHFDVLVISKTVIPGQVEGVRQIRQGSSLKGGKSSRLHAFTHQ
jgi:hypothetical protein